MTLLAMLPSLCTNNLKGLGATLTLDLLFCIFQHDRISQWAPHTDAHKVFAKTSTIDDVEELPRFGVQRGRIESSEPTRSVLPLHQLRPGSRFKQRMASQKGRTNLLVASGQPAWVGGSS